jgi:lactoylglutathione lyase
VQAQEKDFRMEYAHTMVRVSDIEESLAFYCQGLGLVETRRVENEAGRFTLIFLAAPGDVEHATQTRSKELELTYNWDYETYKGGRNFGHLAYRVANLYETCAHLQSLGITINRPPRDGYMAFVKSPDGVSVELLQKGDRLPSQEPWASMKNEGSW